MKDLHSPDGTTNGNLKKRRKIINGERVLLKAGTFPYQQEPFNEQIASALMKRLDIPHVSYDVIWIDGFPYSTCPCFTDKNVEFVENRISYIKRLSERRTESCEEFESDILDLTQKQNGGRK